MTDMAESWSKWLKAISLARNKIPIQVLRNAWIHNREACIVALSRPEPEVKLKWVCSRWLNRYERLQNLDLSTFVEYACLCGLEPGEAYAIWAQIAPQTGEELDPDIYLPRLCETGWRLISERRRELLREPHPVPIDKFQELTQSLRIKTKNNQ